MDTLENCKLSIKESIKDIKDILIPLNESYCELFDISSVFSTDYTGKTKLNRVFFNEKNKLISEKISLINDLFSTIIKNIKDTMQMLFENNDFPGINLGDLVFDDSSFLELFYMDLEEKKISAIIKKKLSNDIEELIALKNRIFNLKFFVSMFDTHNMNKFINKLDADDLINNRLIFETIDTFGLQKEELNNFTNALDNFDSFHETTKSLTSFNSSIELIKRRVDTYVHDDIRYKISLEFINEIKLRNEIYISKAYLENIVSNFIEQSCLDLIKKELKRGKIQKFIEVVLSKTNNKIQLIVKNNGFEEKKIHTLYLAKKVENSYIVEARNLARIMQKKAIVDISSINGEGMQYILELDLA